MMTDPTAFGYANWRFSWGDHICGFFDDPEQQLEVMVPFLAQGLRAKQRCVWVGPPASCERFRNHLGRIGGDLPTLEASGQLVIISEVEFYLEEGMFEPTRSLQLMRTLLADGIAQGYDTMRLVTDIPWTHERRLDPETWEAYEVRLNEEQAGLPVVSVCQYDRRQVTGGIIVAALRTHRFVIMDGELHANPFYVPPAGAPVQVT
jgi:hypothetical protein